MRDYNRQNKFVSRVQDGRFMNCGVASQIDKRKTEIHVDFIGQCVAIFAKVMNLYSSFALVVLCTVTAGRASPIPTADQNEIPSVPDSLPPDVFYEAVGNWYGVTTRGACVRMELGRSEDNLENLRIRMSTGHSHISSVLQKDANNSNWMVEGQGYFLVVYMTDNLMGLEFVETLPRTTVPWNVLVLTRTPQTVDQGSLDAMQVALFSKPIRYTSTVAEDYSVCQQPEQE